MPSGSGALNMWFSFRVGSIHMVSFNSETDFPNSPGDGYIHPTGNFGNQLAWLEQDLAAANNSRATGEVTWIVAGGHRPLYSRSCANADGSATGECANARAAFEALFVKYGVDVIGAGHEHEYESNYPVAFDVVSPSLDNVSAPVYVLQGAAGQEEGHDPVDGRPNPSWSRFNDGTNFGISTITFHNSTSLTFSFRRATDGMELDSWTLTKA
jgi:acid phosphatase type 7